jgi:hypothetical protein
MNIHKGYDYFVNGDITILYLKDKKGNKFNVLIDTKNLEKILSFKYNFYPRYHPNTKEYYVKASIKRNVPESKNGKTILALQRFLLQDKITEKDLVDHINGNKLDNRESNLRITNNSNNLKNRKNINSNNKSGYRNICQVGNRLYVQLQVDGKNTKLASFELDKIKEATEFAKEMRQKYYGEFSGCE